MAAFLAMGACGSPSPPVPPPPEQATAATPAAPRPAPPVSPRPPPKLSDCGASALQYLVGKPHTDIPVPVNPGMRRVVCSTCMITQDYVESRQTITYDTQSGLVTSVRCG
jgi:hypothetical protein